MKYAADFRASAREALRGRWGIAVLAGLLATILGGVISQGPELTFSYDGYGLNANLQLAGQTVYSWGGSPSPIVGALLAGGVFYLLLVGLVLAALFFTLGSVVGVGYARFNLDLLGGERPAVETLFAYFPYWKTTALTRLLQTLYVLLWSLLLIVPGIMAAYSYAMTEFLLADDPDLTPSEALAQSKAMMYGNRWRLFCLQISFIGWSILANITVIGGIFLTPYVETASAAFYRELTAPASGEL